MRESFDAALKRVLVHEGHWSDHPDDPGGATMRGITIGVYGEWLGRAATKEELRAIPDETVAAIYRARYWNVVKADDLPAGVDYAVFDFGVNSGPARSVKYLQQIVGANPDGKAGPETIAKTNADDPERVIRELAARRLTFLKGLKTWPVFGKGWERRVHEVERDAMAMAAGAPPRAETPPPVQPPDYEPPTAKPEPQGLWARFVAFIRRLLGFQPRT